MKHDATMLKRIMRHLGSFSRIALDENATQTYCPAVSTTVIGVWSNAKRTKMNPKNQTLVALLVLIDPQNLKNCSSFSVGDRILRQSAHLALQTMMMSIFNFLPNMHCVSPGIILLIDPEEGKNGQTCQHSSKKPTTLATQRNQSENFLENPIHVMPSNKFKWGNA